MKYYDNYMKSIISGTIEDAGEKDDQEFGTIPFLLVKCSDGERRVVWIMRDPEGNGAGHPELEVVEFR